ncbi:hypothetical protein [Jannaschia helgolandensis]|tara:strand:- start:4629 stop:4769 length:141 start_codon:yes stop_codon:yes gene_type:complete
MPTEALIAMLLFRIVGSPKPGLFGDSARYFALNLGVALLVLADLSH